MSTPVPELSKGINEASPPAPLLCAFCMVHVLTRSPAAEQVEVGARRPGLVSTWQRRRGGRSTCRHQLTPATPSSRGSARSRRSDRSSSSTTASTDRLASGERRYRPCHPVWVGVEYLQQQCSRRALRWLALCGALSSVQVARRCVFRPDSFVSTAGRGGPLFLKIGLLMIGCAAYLTLTSENVVRSFFPVPPCFPVVSRLLPLRFTALHFNACCPVGRRMCLSCLARSGLWPR